MTSLQMLLSCAWSEMVYLFFIKKMSQTQIYLTKMYFYMNSRNLLFFLNILFFSTYKVKENLKTQPEKQRFRNFLKI